MSAPVDEVAVAFVRRLRDAELDVPVGSALLFVDALGVVGLDRPDDVYWAGRATLVHGPGEVATYDAEFRSFWLGRMPAAASSPALTVRVTLAFDTGGEGTPAPAGDEPDGTVLAVRFSAREVLRHKDFAAYSPEELDEAHRLMAGVRVAGARRRSRRRVPSRHERGRPDLRRTVGSALRTGGEPVRRHRVTRGDRARRVVLLVDISGSMEPYARALLRFVQAAVAGRERVEAFTLGTRLTRLTRQLAGHDPDAALTRAAAAVPDWSGGTRLGEGLRHFNDEWGVRGLARGAVVVILSDGWDRGDPDDLGEQMARLHRVAHRVVWVNPLKASPGYQPLAQGMAAALPHVDEFIEGHSLASLEELARVVAR